ncbi:MAG: HTH-type transcriptional regulator skgA (Stationary-phase regulation of katG protein) [Microbacteriaceae bacterium]|nr:HTH-type transcriptional regulator skgA (Stationary-phase regulation of katG protein) [Microbacteriaceae bacterium]
MTNEWPIQEIARLSGTTSRTLRHYGDIGLLPSTRVGANGLRYYDENALVRLQRVLMLRDLGLALPAIASVVDGRQENTDALGGHLRWLRQEKERLDRQIGAVESTIEKLKGGERIMAEEALDGFDHTVYKDEVVERWGADAYAKSDAWYRSLDAAQKAAITSQQADIQRAFAAAEAAGESPESEGVLAIAKRHYDWVTVGWQGKRPTAEQFVGLGELYVADDRFAANYGGREGAGFVRDAMAAYAQREL